jgi:hypothetical protein
MHTPLDCITILMHHLILPNHPSKVPSILWILSLPINPHFLLFESIQKFLQPSPTLEDPTLHFTHHLRSSYCPSPLLVDFSIFLLIIIIPLIHFCQHILRVFTSLLSNFFSLGENSPHITNSYCPSLNSICLSIFEFQSISILEISFSSTLTSIFVISYKC